MMWCIMRLTRRLHVMLHRHSYCRFPCITGGVMKDLKSARLQHLSFLTGNAGNSGQLIPMELKVLQGKGSNSM